jgi:hypothetical protein
MEKDVVPWGLVVGRVVMSLVVPVALLIGTAIIFAGDPSPLGMSLGEFGRMTMLFSIAMGFAPLVRLCGRYVVLGALFYFPMMLVLLMGVVFALPKIFHSDVP